MAHHTTRRGLGTLVLNTPVTPAARDAGTLPVPRSKIILTISSQTKAMNKDGTAEADEAMLEAMDTTEMLTSHSWYDGQVRFEGVCMDRLLDRAEASRHDRHNAELPRREPGQYSVTLAVRLNGATVSTPNIGPVLIVYSHYRKTELSAEQLYSRSVWQAAKLVVR